MVYGWQRSDFKGKIEPTLARMLRVHTYHVLDKTGTNRQTELIRRLFETTLPGAPRGVRISRHTKAT